MIILREKGFLEGNGFYQELFKVCGPFEFVTFVNMIELSEQMSQANLMSQGSDFEVAFPSIMNQDRKSKAVGKMVVKGLYSTIQGSNYKRKRFSLKSPKPALLTVDFHTGFIPAVGFRGFDFFPNEFVGRQRFGGGAADHFYEGSSAHRKMKDCPAKFC